MPQRAPFEEDKHKRAEDGKFTFKSGAGRSTSGGSGRVGSKINVRKGLQDSNRKAAKVQADAKREQARKQRELKAYVRAVKKRKDRLDKQRKYIDDMVNQAKAKGLSRVTIPVPDAEEAVELLKEAGVSVGSERGYPTFKWGGIDVAFYNRRRGRTASVSAPERKAAAKDGEALSDGKLPTRNRSELEAAIKLRGQVDGHSQLEIRSYLIRRARALGAVDALPKEWSA